MNPNSEVFGWAILVATFVGPIAAVIITRWIDAAREKTQRRLVIFRTLMATRAVGLNPERVAALNMIQIDFANTPPVVNAWHDLLAHYGLARPANDQETAGFDRERARLSTVLLDQMAKKLRIHIDQLDILDRVYYPTGLANIELEQEIVRRWFVDLAAGRKALPVLAVVTPASRPPSNASSP